MRDAIAFSNQCFVQAAGKTRLSWEEIKGAEHQYSTNRLLALRDEWKPTYPGIDDVVGVFRGTPARMTKQEFQDRLNDCMVLTAEKDFRGVGWLTEMSKRMWDAVGAEPSWFELYPPQTALLYRIGLVGCSSSATAAPVFFSVDALLASSELSLERCDFFHIHRMFQKAFDVRLASEV